jgi:hypothetical protein
MRSWTFLLLLFALPAVAGQGTAELALDRAAVRELLVVALPPPRVLDLPGAGRATLRLVPPRHVDFRDGGIDLTLDVELVEADWSTSVALRLVPRIDPLTGIVSLVPEKLDLPALPFDLDIAAWLQRFELPRTLGGVVELRDDAQVEMSGFLQGVTVRDDRLVLDLGLMLEGSGLTSQHLDPRTRRDVGK